MPWPSVGLQCERGLAAGRRQLCRARARLQGPLLAAATTHLLLDVRLEAWGARIGESARLLGLLKPLESLDGQQSG